MPSYHDLHITTAKTPRTSIFNLPFNVQVLCTRVGGWEVWARPGDEGDLVLIAGEYFSEGLRLDVAGTVIVDSLGPVGSSFPFLGIARKNDRTYGEVVRFVQYLDVCPSISVDEDLTDWQHEVVAAWAAERRRREGVSA